MCKYCESKVPYDLTTYNNGDSMNVSYGTRQGVQIWAYLKMHGNMLLVDAAGNYRSQFDCYYDSWDLDDCDGEDAHVSKPAYVGIKYCPFCGRELDSNLYEIQSTKDKIKEDKRRLAYNEKVNYLHNIYVNFSRNKLSDIKANEYNKNPLTIVELLESKVDVKGHVHYGMYDEWVFGEHDTLEDFSFDTKVKGFYEFGKESVSHMYKIDADTLRELEKLGLLKVNKRKVANLARSKEKYFNRVEMLTKEIEELENKLKEYE